ncbi:hypothetical protein HQO83_15265 [Rhodococcus fascians]|nr:hypothetical protein [Rhodococcus fascians]
MRTRLGWAAALHSSNFWISIERRRHRDPSTAVLGRHHLIGIALGSHRRAFGVEILQKQMTDPHPRCLDLGDDVACAHALYSTRSVVGLTLLEEISGLLRFGYRRTAPRGHSQGRIVVDLGQTIEISRGQISRVASEEAGDRFGS